jgi:hypothetical protein
LIAPSAGMLLRDLTGRMGTHRGLTDRSPAIEGSQLKEFQKVSAQPSPCVPFREVGSSGGRPAGENVLQRKSPRGVITIDKREVVLPLQRLVKPCKVLYEFVGSPTKGRR